MPLRLPNIAPVVAYLAQSDCPVTGRVFAVEGGAIQPLTGWDVTSTIECERPVGRCRGTPLLAFRR